MTGRVVAIGLAALVLHLILIQPNHPAAATWQALLLFPLELPALILVLIVLPRSGWSKLLQAGLVAALSVIALLKVADFAMFTALGRGFNPVADLALVEAGLRLTRGAMGLPLTLAALLAACLAALLMVRLLWWASGAWMRVTLPRRWTLAAGSAAVLAGGVAIADIGHTMRAWTLPLNPPGAAFTARLGLERVEMVRTTLRNLRDFQMAATDDPFRTREPLLDRIDRDVLVVFVESYGRASLDTPLYAERHSATLRDAADRLAGLGLAMRSGWLRAPTRGGQSWLSHATFANGLWVADQMSYGAVLASERQGLFHLARDAGFHTAAVMPQITLDWPEASLMGFETVLAAADLGYAGLPFNWVTMPDQFTFSALDRLLLHRPDRSDDRAMFVQLALGSSHAPWVPVPDLVAWDQIGDGQVFNAMAQSGEAPDVVWRDRDRIRAQYSKAVDYALRVVFDYAARHAAEPPLIFVVGDHQAAGFVALDDRPDVPVHLIGAETLVAAAASWGWRPGLIPDPAGEVRSMAAMRDLILDAYSSAPATGGGL